MITAAEFLAEAARHGFDFYTGVPCSFLTPLINGVLSSKAAAPRMNLFMKGSLP